MRRYVHVQRGDGCVKSKVGQADISNADGPVSCRLQRRRVAVRWHCLRRRVLVVRTAEDGPRPSYPDDCAAGVVRWGVQCLRVVVGADAQVTKRRPRARTLERGDERRTSWPAEDTLVRPFLLEC